MLLVTSSSFSFSSDGLDASSLIHFASKANKTEEKFICFANHEGQTGAADALFMGLAKVSLINCCHDKFYSGRSQDGNGTFLFSLWQIMSQVRLHTLWLLLQSYIHQELHFAKGGTKEVNYDGTICLFIVANQLKFMTNWSFHWLFNATEPTQ